MDEWPGRADEPHALVLVLACNVAMHRQGLTWRTPFQAIGDAWSKIPRTFKINPRPLIPGPNTWTSFAKSALDAAGSRRHTRFRKAD
jgi:hypothetical protein